MSKASLIQPVGRGLATMFFTTVLAACGGGGGTDSVASPASSAAPASQQAQNSPGASRSPSDQPSGNTGTAVVSGPASLGPDARFNSPDGIAVTPNGDVYVVDAGNATIRRIGPSGEVATIAGSPGVAGSADGSGSAAAFSQPAGIAADRAGNLYVADTGNNTIRKITPSGTVTTLAGIKGTRGVADGASASFLGPRAISADGAGNLYVTDTYFIPSPILSRDMSTVRRVAPDGTVTTMAGQPNTSGGRTDTDGTGSDARFYNASGITVDTGGSVVYVADTSNQSIRRMTAGGTVDTLRVTTAGGSAASFAYPRGIALAADGNLYVADTGNHVIRRIAPDGSSMIIAGRNGEQGSNDRSTVSPF